MPTNFIDNWGNFVTRVNTDGGSAWKAVTVTKTFSAAAGKGNIGTVALFTVTGFVKCKLYARCTTTLTADGAATFEIGVTGSTAGLIALTTATAIDTTEIWHDASPDAPLELSSVSTEKLLIGSIFGTVKTANLTAGVIEFTLLYSPLSTDATVVGV